MDPGSIWWTEWLFSLPLSLFSTVSTNSLGMLLRNGFSCTASPSHVLCNDFGSSFCQSKDVPILPVIETFLHYPRSPLHQPLPIQRTRLILLHKTIPCLCHPSLTTMYPQTLRVECMGGADTCSRDTYPAPAIFEALPTRGFPRIRLGDWFRRAPPDLHNFLQIRSPLQCIVSPTTFTVPGVSLGRASYPPYTSPAHPPNRIL